jgi:uroporphyrinogen-III decarboxylase
MENLMVDYYEHPEEIHRLHRALARQYAALIRRAAREIEPDGFWTSDDLGHQTALFMSPKTFRTFLKPYYARVGEALKRHGVHWWLHSCGNNTAVLGDLVEVGLDVFHPVQKHTMDEVQVAREFGDRLTFLVGFDVQQTLAYGTPADVRAEVRRLVQTFNRPEGGMCLAAGNGILPGTPLENVEAFLDEALAVH